MKTHKTELEVKWAETQLLSTTIKEAKTSEHGFRKQSVTKN